ncbi:hypothetical protein GC163_03240 [bacterium]|nr:hypothetical protein [bacterium]
MHIQHIAIVALATQFVTLTVGCSQTSPAEAKLRQDFSIASDIPVQDLGVVELRAGTPKLVSLGKDKDLTITATVLAKDLLQMNLVYEAKDVMVQGQPADVYSERSQFLLRPGMRCAPNMGQHLVVVMKPTVAQ